MRFTIKDIVEAPDGSVVPLDLVNERVSFIVHNTSFAVLADQQTVLTLEENDDGSAKNLVRQNLRDKTVSVLASLDDDWFPETLLPDEKRDTLLVTGMFDKQHKSRMELRELSSGHLLKVFAFPDVFIVVEALRVHDLVFLGCSDNILKVLDAVRSEIVYDSVKTAIGVDVTMDLCRVVDPQSADAKFVLALGGSMPDYSQGKTDLFDVTQLVRPSGQPSPEDLEIAALEHELSRLDARHRQKMTAIKKRLQDLPRLQVKPATANARKRCPGWKSSWSWPIRKCSGSKGSWVK